jgi:type I restriction enzyme S subunit
MNGGHDLRPYPEYKDSGLPWLGEIPAHWEVRRIKRFARVGNGSTPSRGKIEYWTDTGFPWTDTGFPWLNSASVHQEKITKASRFVTDLALVECHLPRLEPGSVLVAITGQGKTRGNAALLTFPATINQHIVYIAPRGKDVLGNYLRYFLMAAYRQLRALSDDSGGTKGALTCEDVKQFDVAIPPTDEQCAIADFLDHNDQLVHRFIRKKRRVIELLNEQKQAIINRAVTRGLDSNVKLKPSGMPCLGDVPEHWEVKRLKSLAQIRYGLGQPPRETESGLPLIRATNVDHGRIVQKNLVPQSFCFRRNPNRRRSSGASKKRTLLCTEQWPVPNARSSSCRNTARASSPTW